MWRRVGWRMLISSHCSIPFPYTGGPELSSFEPVTTEEVRKLLSGMPSNFEVVIARSPAVFVTQVVWPLLMCSRQPLPDSLTCQAGKFPARYKRARVLPLLEKAVLNSSETASYRSISNWRTVSKFLETLVLARLRPHRLSSANFSHAVIM